MNRVAADDGVVQEQLAAAREEAEERIRAGRLGSVDDLRERFPAVWEPVRLWEGPTGRDTAKESARLSADDRAAVSEILRDTESGLPACWEG